MKKGLKRKKENSKNESATNKMYGEYFDEFGVWSPDNEEKTKLSDALAEFKKKIKEARQQKNLTSFFYVGHYQNQKNKYIHYSHINEFMQMNLEPRIKKNEKFLIPIINSMIKMCLTRNILFDTKPSVDCFYGDCYLKKIDDHNFCLMNPICQLFFTTNENSRNYIGNLIFATTEDVKFHYGSVDNYFDSCRLFFVAPTALLP